MLVVVAYGEILRPHVLELAPHGALNVHPSLLPRYRGATPVRAAILNGDEATGVSIIRLVKKLDAGPVIRQREVEIQPRENAHELESRLAHIAAEILPDTCLEWIDGAVEAREQDESCVSLTREWSRDDARIDWSVEATLIERLVRASQPWPIAWTTLDGEPFRIHAASLEPATSLPIGTVRREGRRILAGCGSGGALVLDDVQPAGKRPMPAMNWWNGVQADEVRFDRDGH